MKLLSRLILTLSALIIASGYSHATQSKIIGEYIAVTETELVIELTLLDGNKAKLKTGYLKIEPDEPGLFTITGTWQRVDDTLYLKFVDYEDFEYQIIEKLPYEEFGYPGGSFGLKPIKTDHPITRFGLWRKSAIQNLE